MRFAEIYQDSIHENVSCDGKSWQEAQDVLNETQEFEPTNTDLLTEAEQQVIVVDELLVHTTRKRKYYPRKIIKHITTEQNCYHKKLEQYEPNISEKVGELEDTISDDVKSSMLGTCQTTARNVSSLMKSLPSIEVRSERLLTALQEHESQQSSKTRQIISKPSRGEGEMLRSLTPLKRLIEEDVTPSPKGKGTQDTLKTDLAMRRLRSHSITTYNLRRSPKKKIKQ
ncbi:uncharacterized protein LOC144447170 [Glandiceps talaboti]